MTDGPLGIPESLRDISNYYVCIYTSNHIIKKISVEKSKWNVALSHLEELRFSILEQRRGTFSLASLHSSLKVIEMNYESEGL